MSAEQQFDGEVPEEEEAASSGATSPDPGEPTQAATEQSESAPSESPEAAATDALLEKAAADLAAERLADLQRITAEFKNFRKRTDEQLALQHERAKGDAAKAILPVLDDIDLAEKHGDLVEGSAFATIAQKLRAVGEHLGLVKFAEQGDVFDHNIHDAVLQQPNPDITVATVAEVVSPGYRLGGTLVRAAKVVVWTPQD